MKFKLYVETDKMPTGCGYIYICNCDEVKKLHLELSEVESIINKNHPNEKVSCFEYSEIN